MSVNYKTAVEMIRAGIAPEHKLPQLVLKQLPNETLPAGLRASRLVLSEALHLRTLPDDLEVTYLTIEKCPALERLPEGLHLRRLNISNAGALRMLPEGLHAQHVELSHCEQLAYLAALRGVRLLYVFSCPIEALPPIHISDVLLQGCAALRALPDGAQYDWLTLKGMSLTSVTNVVVKIAFTHWHVLNCTIYGTRGRENIYAWLNARH